MHESDSLPYILAINKKIHEKESFLNSDTYNIQLLLSYRAISHLVCFSTPGCKHGQKAGTAARTVQRQRSGRARHCSRYLQRWLTSSQDDGIRFGLHTLAVLGGHTCIAAFESQGRRGQICGSVCESRSTRQFCRQHGLTWFGKDGASRSPSTATFPVSFTPPKRSPRRSYWVRPLVPTRPTWRTRSSSSCTSSPATSARSSTSTTCKSSRGIRSSISPRYIKRAGWRMTRCSSLTTRCGIGTWRVWGWSCA